MGQKNVANKEAKNNWDLQLVPLMRS